MHPGAAVNGRGEVTGLCVLLSAGIFPMCRDPAGPMSSDGELGLGPMPAVTAAAPEGETTRSRQEEEERVILRAWQNMSSTLRQQRDVCEETRASGPALSFLSRQRQWTQARRAQHLRLQPR